MANPKYTQAEKEKVIEAALQSIATGQSLNAFCKANKYPYKTVYDWLVDDATNPAYARAKDIGTHYLANECLDIADGLADLKKMRIDSALDNDGPSLGELVQVAKVRIDTRMRLIGKWNRRDYGDKVSNEITGADGGPIEYSVIRREIIDSSDDKDATSI